MLPWGISMIPESPHLLANSVPDIYQALRTSLWPSIPPRKGTFSLVTRVLCQCVSVGMAWDPAPSRASRGASDRAQVEATTYLLSPQPVRRVTSAPTVPMCVRVGKGRPVILCRGLVSVLLGRLESTVNMVSVCRGLGTCTVHRCVTESRSRLLK